MASRRSSALFAVAIVACAGLADVVGCSNGNVAAPPRPKSAAPEAKVSKEARETLERMAAFLAGKKGFALRQSSTTTAADEDLAAKFGGTTEQTILVERPARILVAVAGDGKGAGTAASDGTTFVVHQKAKNRYESATSPASLAEIVSHPLVGGLLALGNGDTVNRVFFAETPVESLLEGVRELDVAGGESVDGRECTHLIAKTEGSGWDLWIAVGDEPVPVKFVPGSSRMRSGDKEVEVKTEVTFDQWRLDPAFDASDFAFVPPEGAEKVDSILGAAEQDGRRKAAARPSLHATVGFPAPGAALPSLDGDRFDPAEAAKGKVVVLDFWATWCGPCRVSLPVVARVCKEYADKGVVFRAVNVKEDAETIRQFLAEEPIDATVVMDSSGETLAAYRVEAIPHTVVIGGDGLVQAVHVGASDDLEAKLRKQLDAILEGKSLVPKGGNQARAEPL